MVEAITQEALSTAYQSLRSAGRLGAVFMEEIERLVSEAPHFSNWTDTSHYLSKGKYTCLQAGGPISKVLRTLAFVFAKLSEQKEQLIAHDLKVIQVQISNARSGCSDYTGHIMVTGENQERSEQIFLSGPFVWDCAQQGLPQTLAAQQKGYQCMVLFPPLQELSA